MDKEIYHKMSVLEDSHWWFVGRRNIIKTILDDLNFSNKIQILEIGCGTGGNFPILQKYGQIFGVESDETARDYATKRNMATILAGKLPDEIPFSDQLFDLIILTDVLEHVDEDELSLNNLHKRLTNCGYILITVPAFQFLWGRHDESHHHKRRYTKHNLCKMISNVGYEIMLVSYFNTFLFPIIAVMRIFNNLFSLHNNDDLISVPQLINNILIKLFNCEKYLIKTTSLPFGVSLLVIARHNGFAGF
jgi:SAM-dependent methyltransferase